jgi:hypothetical protein
MIERPLFDDATLLNQVRRLIARLTVMKIATNGQPLVWVMPTTTWRRGCTPA